MLALQFGLSFSSQASGSDAHALPLLDQVQELRLENGLTALFLPRPGMGILSCRVLFKIGGVDVPAGRSGLAHLFEHLAFKGTHDIGSLDPTREAKIFKELKDVSARRIALLESANADTHISELTRLQEDLIRQEESVTEPSAFPKLLDEVVFSFNATTSADFTEYFFEVPSDRLDAWMKIEGHRLLDPSFRNFFSELEVVKQERRDKVDGRPMALAREKLASLAFPNHPYGRPTIGWSADLKNLGPADAVEFQSAQYGGENAVCVFVGDFDLAEAKTLVRKYFGRLRRTDPPRAEPLLKQTATGSGRTVLLEAQTVGWLAAFPSYPPGDRRAFISEVLAEILNQRNVGRLQVRLRKTEPLATNIQVESNGGFQRYPGLFLISVEGSPGIRATKLEEVGWSELSRLTSEGPGADEVRRAERSLYLKSLSDLESNATVARLLARAQAAAGDWRSIERRLQQVGQVTPEDVGMVARDLFVPEKCTTVLLEAGSK